MENLRAKPLQAAPSFTDLDSAFEGFQKESLNSWSEEEDERRSVIRFWIHRYLNPASIDERILARMALNCLCAPGISASPERLFRSAIHTISKRRCRLGDDVIRVLECFKAWSRAGLIASAGDPSLFGEILEALHRENDYIEKYGDNSAYIDVEYSRIELEYWRMVD